ncbi:unnamed protein product [Prunus armeniaca]
MAADRSGERLGLEEGGFVVHLALILPESGVGAERKQLPKLAGRGCLTAEKSGFIKTEVRDIYARDILAIPAITVASEATFSVGGRVIYELRACILPETVEALVTTKDWLPSKIRMI